MTASVAFITVRDAAQIAKRGSRQQGTINAKKNSTTLVAIAEGANWPRPPPINTPVDKSVGNGFYDYHGEKGHSTD
ncbi:hypothetical protein Tco_0837971 [Tanacetum coccineum]